MTTLRPAPVAPTHDVQLGRPYSPYDMRAFTVRGALSSVERERLRAIASSARFQPGQVIIGEGDPASDVFSIVAGTVKSYRLLPDGRRQIIGFPLQGDFLGVAVRDTYAFSAEAIGCVELCRFPRNQLVCLFAELPSLERRMLGEVGHELTLAQNQMLLLGRKAARERVASFFVTYAKRTAQWGSSREVLDLPMRRTDISDYLGLTTETVSRTITALRRLKLITIPKSGQIRIINRARLNALTGDG
jgi:CRP/FNR family transcriptional regulator